MKKLKSLVVMLFAMLCLALPVQAQQKINIYVDNAQQTFSVDPIIQNGSTLVPMRELFNLLGYKITWNDPQKTVYAEKDSMFIEITINNTVAYIDGTEVALTAPAVIHKNTTMVPLRFVAESTGYNVEWFGDTYSVAITTDGTQTITPTETPKESTIENVSVMINTNVSQGSGTIISPDGYIVTNYHVLKDAEKDSIIVMFNDEKYYYGKTSLIYVDKDRDVAVLKIDTKNLPYAKIGDSSTVKIGDAITAMGSPLGKLNVKTEGVVLEQNSDYFSTSAVIEHGSSGGGLFNANGELIGISHSYDDLKHYYSIPVNYLDTTKFADPSSPMDMSVLKQHTLTPPIGFEAYYENTAVYFKWVQNVDAQYYCLFSSDQADGDCQPLLNPNNKKNQWLWGFPYGMGMSVRTHNKQTVYYKIASFKDGVMSPLSEAIAVEH